MNDQLAAGILWREVARRARDENDGTEVGEALAKVAREIAEDVETFKRIMRRLGIRASPIKPAVAIAAERIGRLKLNGRLLGYSPLSRFAELDFLVMGIEGKVILWANLRDLTNAGEPGEVDFDGLIDRAKRQRDLLEPHRTAAGRRAFA